MLSKTLTKTVRVGGFGNRLTRQILSNAEDAYKKMLKEMVEYAVRRGASQATLHKVFYAKFRAEYPWLPTRLIKGAYRDAVRRAKSFRDAKKRGKAYTEAPEVRRVALTFSDARDWRLEDGVLKLRIGGRWAELRCLSHKQLHRYLYSGWRLAEELRLKRVGKRWVAHLTFKKEFDVNPDLRNVVALNINENNITAAVFVGGGFRPLVIRAAVRGASGRVRPVKTRLRVGEACGEVWERDVLGAVNIGLRYLQMGGFVASAPTGAHAARAMLMNPRLGPTPLAEISTIIARYR
jgi:transposase